MASSMKSDATFEHRKQEADRILSKYPDRVPVICEKAEKSSLPEIDKKKFLVPGSMAIGNFKYIIQKHITKAAEGNQEAAVAPDQTIYLFIKDKTSLKQGTALADTYTKYKDEDGFLYMTYSAENTLG
mmetsp:Transcript_97140/g.202887  ORF Transcript_97140/g.202887 Transcript_97140/m.202887 type:complete len:128 (+) Transcript_97140:100-483(+)